MGGRPGQGLPGRGLERLPEHPAILPTPSWAVNALRIGPDGQLWIVDKGAPGPGKDVLPGGAKVVVVDLETNKVNKVIPLDAVTGKKSFVDDIRFNRRPRLPHRCRPAGLIVLDLASGRMWRALDGDRSVTQERTLMAEG